MTELIRNEAFSVLGLPLRTSNAEGFTTIPAHWQRFFGESVLARIEGRIGDEIFAVYTDFDNAGRNNDGIYTLVIGARVAPGHLVPEGLALTHVPASRRCVFEVPHGQPERVGEAWQAVWARSDLPKTFLSDYEQYGSDGNIRILVGVD